MKSLPGENNQPVPADLLFPCLASTHIGAASHDHLNDHIARMKPTLQGLRGRRCQVLAVGAAFMSQRRRLRTRTGSARSGGRSARNGTGSRDVRAVWPWPSPPFSLALYRSAVRLIVDKLSCPRRFFSGLTQGRNGLNQAPPDVEAVTGRL